MHEDFLHYLWKHKKIDVLNLVTTDFETIEIVSVGQHNLNSGPDCFNAQLRIAEQHWAGNVEIHLKSSDWFLHNHETDKAYDNVILHVVWEHDTDVFRKDNKQIKIRDKLLFRRLLTPPQLCQFNLNFSLQLSLQELFDLEKH